MTGTSVGFVGLGLMGQGFTQRLCEKGYRVVGYDVDAGKTRAAAAWGVTPADSAAEVADAADIVLVCVINTAAVEDVTLGRARRDCRRETRRKNLRRSFDH